MRDDSQKYYTVRYELEPEGGSVTDYIIEIRGIR